MDATYLRSGGRSGTRICYRRMGVGRPTKRLNAKVRGKVARVANMIYMLAPDVADTILALPSRRVGRMFKAALRRTQKSAHKRCCFRRRPTSCIFRIEAGHL
ncbi:MAG: hypothetical protein JWQ50_4715 [Caballeronia mineralivorans]|nr:hypothetical protein [Caballeronia mineralivorans]